MAVKQAKPKSGKKAAARKAKPAYLCTTCGLEVTVNRGDAKVSPLVCCEQVMTRKK